MSAQTGYIFKSAYFLNLSFLDDIEIYQLAKNNETKVILISKDADFANIINRFGSPPKLINKKTGNRNNQLIFRFISNFLKIQ